MTVCNHKWAESLAKLSATSPNTAQHQLAFNQTIVMDWLVVLIVLFSSHAIRDCCEAFGVLPFGAMGGEVKSLKDAANHWTHRWTHFLSQHGFSWFKLATYVPKLL